MRKLSTGISFLISKNLQPLPEEELFEIIMDQNYFGNDHLEMLFYDRKTLKQLAEDVKEFVSLFENHSQSFPVLLLIENSDAKLEKLETMRGSYIAAVEDFVGIYRKGKIYDNYLEALLLLSLAYRCPEYFSESVVTALLNYCSHAGIWF